jgi:hypothetical protein
MAGEGLAVQMAARVLDVSESGYYEFRSRGPSAREIRHAWLTDLVREVEMLMNQAAIQGVTGRPRWRRGRAELISKDLVERGVRPDRAEQVAVTDITEHHTREGRVYCAVVLDTAEPGADHLVRRARIREFAGWVLVGRPTAAWPRRSGRGRSRTRRRPGRCGAAAGWR